MHEWSGAQRHLRIKLSLEIILDAPHTKLRRAKNDIPEVCSSALRSESWCSCSNKLLLFYERDQQQDSKSFLVTTNPLFLFDTFVLANLVTTIVSASRGTPDGPKCTKLCRQRMNTEDIATYQPRKHHEDQDHATSFVFIAGAPIEPHQWLEPERSHADQAFSSATTAVPSSWRPLECAQPQRVFRGLTATRVSACGRPIRNTLSLSLDLALSV